MSTIERYECLTPEQTVECGREFAERISGIISETGRPVFVAMFGEMGAGKTTFVRGMADVLAPEARVYSPTYSLINLYEGKVNLYHADLYRITGEDDLYSSGFYEILDEDSSVTVCEWCERIPSLLPENRFSVTIEGSGDGKRTITIEENGGQK